MTISSRMCNEPAARSIVTGIGSGMISEHLLHPKFSAWSLSAGEFTGERFLDSMQRFASLFEPPLQVDIVGVTDGGDRVAVEAVSRGTLRGAGSYANSYHFLLIFEAGLLRELREYLDPRALDAVRPLLA